jgi:hypothetical protein
MSFYLLRNGISGHQICDAEGRFCKWLNKVVPGCEFIEVESESDQEKDIQETILDDEIIRIVNIRSPYLPKGFVPTLARGEADFSSLNILGQFFEQAVRRGAAVCQILKKCSTADIDSFMTAVKENLYTLEQLREVLYDAKIENEFWQLLDPTNTSDIKKLRDKIEARNQAKEFYVPIGTGFLVGRNYLLTNNHVLSNPEAAKDFIARFGYDRSANLDDNNLDFPPVDYELDSSSFAFSPPNELDYTLIKVKSGKTDLKRGLTLTEAGDNFGWLPLFEDDALIAPPLSKETLKKDGSLMDNLAQDLKTVADLFGLSGEPVNIIQHPRGRAKEIVFYSNRVQKISPKYIQYEADTDLGSSGSPVLNRQWQTVALHHAVLVEEKEDGIDIHGSLGTRACEIVKHIKTFKELGISQFAEEFVIPKGGFTKPRGTIYILAEIIKQGTIEISEEIISELSNKIKSIANNIKEAKSLLDFGYEVKLIPVPSYNLQSDGEIIFDWLEKPPEFRVGDIALRITMDAYVVQESKSDEIRVIENESLRGIGVFYAGNRIERQAQAQLFLQEILNQEIEQTIQEKSEELESVHRKTISLILPNRGVRSDLTFIREPEELPDDKEKHEEHYKKLPFTRSLGIPSLILRLGFITNPEDRSVVTQYENEIVQGISKGLLAWGNSINPVPMEAYRPKFDDPSDDYSQEDLLRPQNRLLLLLL